MTRLFQFAKGALRTRLFWCQAIPLAYVLLCFGPNFEAKFWFVDDHEIIGALLRLREGFGLIGLTMDSEVAYWGKSLRFRPAYYFLHSLEVFLAGGWPLGWYLRHLAILWQMSAALLFIASGYWGLAPALAAWVIASALPLWADIFSRLGPGELYCCFGTLLCAWAWMADRAGRRTLSAALFLLGALSLAGSKELFAPVACLFALAFGCFRRKQPAWLAACLTIFVYSVWILAGVALATSAAPRDAVGQSLRMADRLLSVFGAAKTLPFWGTVLAGGGLVALKPRAWPWFVGLSGFFMWNFVFYAGAWPTGMRYDFPAFLIPIVLGGALASALLDRLPAKARVYGAYGMLAVAIGTAIPWWDRLTDAARANRDRTERTDRFVRDAVAAARAMPNADLVFESKNPLEDYEFFFSMGKFLRYAGAERPLLLRMARAPEEFPADSLQADLARQLARLPQYVPSARPCLSLHVGSAGPRKCDAGNLVYER